MKKTRYMLCMAVVASVAVSTFAGDVARADRASIPPARVPMYNGSPEITWSVMLPTAIDVGYMRRVAS